MNSAQRGVGGVGFRTLIMALLFAATGCATVGPYQRPPAGATLKQREQIYLDHRIVCEPVSGAFIGKKFPVDHRGMRSFPGYYADSGDSEAVRLYRGGVERAWPGLGLMVVGAVSPLVAVASAPAAPALLLLGYLPGWGGAMAAASWVQGDYFVPAAEHFNAYLKRDLGLEGDTGLPAATADGRPVFEDENLSPGSEWYAFIASGYEWFSNHDIADYYNIPSDTPSENTWPAALGVQTSAGLGTVRPGGATLELRFDVLDRGEPGRYYTTNGSRIPASAMDLDAFNLGLVPGYTWTLERFRGGQRIRAFVGCDAGVGFLAAHGVYNSPQGQNLGTENLGGAVFEGGPIFRVQLPVARFWAVSTEIGWRYEKFGDISVSGADGAFAGMPSPATTWRGSRAFLDFSGPFADLNIQFGHFGWTW